jgi:peptidoglycan/LPS O-acetylase OafA/YrhL
MQISVPVAAPAVSRTSVPAVAASDASPAVMLAPLTSLRFFAAAMIVVSHAAGHFGIPLLHDPAILMQGVSFFFVLSGFILAYRYPALDGKQAVRFFVARFARLWPLYLLSTIVWVILVPAWVQDSIYQKTIGTTLANLFLVQTWAPFSSLNSSYNLVAWSISTEMFLYLCFPLLIRRWYTTWHWKMLAVLALALGMICVSTFAVPHFPPDMRSPYSYAYDSPLTRLWEFTVGIGAAMLWRRWHPRLHLSRRRATALEVGALCLAVGVMASAARIGGPVSTLYRIGDAMTLWLKLAGLTALPFALLITVMALGRGLLSRLLAFAPLVLLGEISYAMYLLHDAFITWIGSHVRPFDNIPAPMQAVLFTVLLLIASYAAWALVETPCRRSIVALWDRFVGHQTRRGGAETIYPRPRWLRVPRFPAAVAIGLIATATIGWMLVPAAPAPKQALSLQSLAAMQAVTGRAQAAIDAFGAITPVPSGTITVDRAQIGDGPLYIAGWALDMTQRMPLKEVDLIIDKNMPLPTQYGLARPDVASALGDAALAPVGYAATIPVTTLTPGPHTIQIVAIFGGGQAYEYAGTLSFEVR